MFVEPPVIDCHAHVFVRRMPFAATAWTKPDYEYPVEAFLADLDAHGVSFGVVTAASLYGDYNDYTLEALGQHRRLRATVMVDRDIDRPALERMAAQGVVGVRLQWSPRVELPDLQGHGWRKLFYRMADLGLHAELNLSGPQIAQALPQIEACGVRIVVDHFGLLRAQGGMECEGFRTMLQAIARGSTWAKVSAGFRFEPGVAEAYGQRLLAEAGPERLFWGSDAPYVGKEGVTYRETLELFYRMVPSAEVRRRMSDAALRFYLF